MSYWEDDGPDVELYVTRQTKAARREHKCSGCPDPILCGQPFARTSSKVDGVFVVSRFHVPMCPRDLRAEETQWALDAELFNQAVR